MPTQQDNSTQRLRQDNTITNPATVTQPIGVQTVAGGLFRPEGGARDLKDQQTYALQNLRPWQGVLHTRPGRQAFGAQVASDEAVIYLTNVRLRDVDEPVAVALTNKSVYVKLGGIEADNWVLLGDYTSQAIGHDTHITTTTIKGSTADEVMLFTFDQILPVGYTRGLVDLGTPNRQPGRLTLGGSPI